MSRCATRPVRRPHRLFCVPEPFHLTAITHRKDAVYPATIVGIPPMERLLHGRRVRETFPAHLQVELPRDRRHCAAGRRPLPQPGLRPHLRLIRFYTLKPPPE